MEAPKSRGYALTGPLAITACGVPEGYFSLTVIAFGAFQFIVSKYDCRLANVEIWESRLLDLRRL